jgi:hypothetical protein
MEKRHFILVLFVLIFLTAHISVFSQVQDDTTLNKANQNALSVSIIDLIANPDMYDGKLVRVIGVGNIEFEGNAIYLSRDDWKYVTKNGLQIELSSNASPRSEAEKFNGKYVIVEGVFNMRNKGHFDMWSGSIINVTRYELWES